MIIVTIISFLLQKFSKSNVHIYSHILHGHVFIMIIVTIISFLLQKFSKSNVHIYSHILHGHVFIMIIVTIISFLLQKFNNSNTHNYLFAYIAWAYFHNDYCYYYFFSITEVQHIYSHILHGHVFTMIIVKIYFFSITEVQQEQYAYLFSYIA